MHARFDSTLRNACCHISDRMSLLTLRSYWLGARQPCLTFGLRGVIHATVKVRSPVALV